MADDMKVRLYLFLLTGLSVPVQLTAQEKPDYRPEIHGTVRAKYEYQPDEEAGRFEVRNARVSVTGQVNPIVTYKAEIDFSDEGNIKMLDAYARLKPARMADFTIGQMRVPFTIDAHRSPHQQYFANRSFIAKQVGNVRDVGATVGCRFNAGFPITVEGGLFNGSGLTGQKDYWTRSINFSAKATVMLPCGIDVVLSTQKTSPEGTDIYMYDAGLSWHNRRWHVEAEYLRKHYADGKFPAVNAFNSFVCYDLPLRRVFSKVSFLGRFDCMGDHSDGTVSEGALVLTDAGRKRLTGGITLSLDKAFIADIRINYEKYFYGSDANIKISEQDKFVIELMTRF